MEYVYIDEYMYTRRICEKQQVMTAGGAATHHVHLIGPHPILRHFLGRMTLARIVNSCLGTPREHIVDHADTLSVLVQNIILSPAPLYRIAEWAEPVEPDALGITVTEKQSLNDDRIARTLDVLAAPRARNLFFRLALRVISEFELDTQRIHHDTTTITFLGKYENSVKEPKITEGINKDHRPDLKQLVFGLNVTADGAVPVSHDVFSGNRTDDTIHRGNLERLRELLGRDGFIYVADSKLCTKKNLAYIDSYGGRFVTILPRTRGEDKRFREYLRSGGSVRWRLLLELPPKRRSDPPDVYHTTSEGPKKTAEGYRIVWCRSSQKVKLDAQIRETNMVRARAELFELNGRLNKGNLKDKASITSAVNTILQRRKCIRFLKVDVKFTVETRTKRLRPGRPAKDDPVRKIRKRRYYLEVRRIKKNLQAEARVDGVFPILTNLPQPQYPKKEVLCIYKYQPYIEKRHALFKTELEIAPVYLKTPRRVVGLIHATFIAMILDALMERTVRSAMKRQGIESLPILPEGRLSKTPTTARILEMFSGVAWYEFERGGENVTFPIRLSNLQAELLRLLGMNPKEYS